MPLLGTHLVRRRGPRSQLSIGRGVKSRCKISHKFWFHGQKSRGTCGIKLQLRPATHHKSPNWAFVLFVRAESGISRNHSGNERILSHRIHFVVDSFEEIVWRCVPRWLDKTITEGVSCLMRDGFGWCLESLRDAPSSQSPCQAMPELSDPLTNDLSRCCAVSNFISTTVLNTLRGALTSLAPCGLSSRQCSCKQGQRLMRSAPIHAAMTNLNSYRFFSVLLFLIS